MDSIVVNIVDIVESITVNITDIPDQITVSLTECLSKVYTDGVTIIGDGTMANPLTAIISTVSVLYLYGNDVAAYQDNLLIGKALLLVTNDNVVRIPTDYNFNNGTGTITFLSTIDSGVVIQILYV